MKQFVDLVSVSKEYGDSGSRVKALDGVSLSVEQGGIAVVLGASGAGKTTLLNLIAGLEKPTGGQIRVLGMELASASEGFLSEFRSTNIGFIFQSYNLLSTLTAQENVELMMELAGSRDFEKNEKLAADLITLVGLTSRANHLPAQLSGGEQQRIAVARALANDPALVLADEPTGNLDTTTGLVIVRLLGNLKEKHGKTLIISTHDERIVEMADVVFRLEDGRLAGVDRPHRVRS